MRLREVGPGIGGLNYGPLLRDVKEREMLRALERLPVRSAGNERLERLWTRIQHAARKIGQAVIDVRMAQARQIIEDESAHLRIDGSRRDTLGARYY